MIGKLTCSRGTLLRIILTNKLDACSIVRFMTP